MIETWPAFIKKIKRLRSKEIQRPSAVTAPFHILCSSQDLSLLCFVLYMLKELQIANGCFTGFQKWSCSVFCPGSSLKMTVKDSGTWKPLGFVGFNNAPPKPFWNRYFSSPESFLIMETYKLAHPVKPFSFKNVKPNCLMDIQRMEALLWGDFALNQKMTELVSD